MTTSTDITHLGQLTSDPKNARKHTPRNVGSIVSALHEVGAARSIVIDENGVVLAGNATIEAAGQAGIERVRVIDADGDEIIAVRRSNLSAKQKTRLALFDNRAAEQAEWDTDVLAELNDEGLLDGMFFDNELGALLGGEGDVDVNELWKGMPEFEQDDLGAWKSIKVHFASQADYEAFARLVSQTLTDQTKYIWYPYKERFDHMPYKAEDES